MGNALTGAGLHASDGDMKVVQALMGRSEAHPTSVLTGSDWLAYFDKAGASHFSRSPQMAIANS